MKRHSLPKISSSFTCDTTTSTPLVFTSKTGKPPFVTQFSITLSKVSGKLDVWGCKALHRCSGLVEPNLLAKREFQMCNSWKTLAYLSDRYVWMPALNLSSPMKCLTIRKTEAPLLYEIELNLPDTCAGEEAGDERGAELGEVSLRRIAWTCSTANCLSSSQAGSICKIIWYRLWEKSWYLLQLCRNTGSIWRNLR
jgi:hypothetical protein